MKKIYKTIKISLLALLSIFLSGSAFADHSDGAKAKIEVQVEQDNEAEFYDYHAGVTYTRTLQRILFDHMDKHSAPLDKNPSEATSQQ